MEPTRYMLIKDIWDKLDTMETKLDERLDGLENRIGQRVSALDLRITSLERLKFQALAVVGVIAFSVQIFAQDIVKRLFGGK